MTVINTNVGAITARTYATNSSSTIEDNLKKLSSGRRVNSGSDDAAGLAVAYKLESQLRSTNMAIQNASNGVSLIQTAGSGMNKVNSMLVRIREVSVQMANGIYTDKDRANAQAEVTLLKEEIDKISENLQFNQVYLLDGSYEQSFRTGVSNEETFGLSIISQRAEELGKESGLKAFGTKINSSSHDESLEAVEMSVTDASTIQIENTQFGAGFQTFLNNNPSATFELSGDDAALFNVSQDGTIESNQINFNSQNPAENKFEFNVTAKTIAGQYTNKISLTLNENETQQIVKSSTSNLTAAESAMLTFRAVNSSNASDGQLSLALQSFVEADNNNGAFSISGGVDANLFTVDGSTGVVSASIDYEIPSDQNNDRIYELQLTYTSSTGDQFLETINLTITDAQEEVVNYQLPGSPALLVPSRFNLEIDGQTINSAAMAATPAVSFSELAGVLNAANTALSTPARASFKASGNGVEAVFSNAAGDVASSLTSSPITISQRLETSTTFVNAVTGVDATAATKTYTGLSGAVNIAKAGDVFTYDFNGTIITTIVGQNQQQGDFSIADLALGLNTANAAMGSPQAVTFSVSEDDLVATRTLTGTFPANRLGDVTFNGQTLSNASTSSNGVAGANRTVTLDVGTPPGWGYSLGGGDTPEIYIDGQKYVGAALPTGSHAELATSLNNVLNSIGISVSYAANNLSFTMTGMPAATANSINFEQLDLWASPAIASIGTTRTDADSIVSFNGASNNSASGRDNSASGNNTDGAVISQLAKDKAVQQSTQTIGARSKINFEDNFTISLSAEDFSAQMKTFSEANPFGEFSLKGADVNHFKIDTFNGTIRTTASFKANPKNSYNIEVIYTAKNGKSFSNELVLTRDPLQNIVNDSVADVDISTSEGATTAITILDRAINQMAAQEAEMGAAQNRLEHAIDYLAMAGLNTAASKSRIIDADFADVSSKLAKHQILNQASTSMLAQANSSKQMLMQLLR